MGQHRFALVALTLMLFGADPSIHRGAAEATPDAPSKVHCEKSTLEQSVLTLCGSINIQSVSFVERSISQGAKKIRISSLGGSERSALRILRLVRDNGFAVEIFDRCYSACAHIFLMLAENVSVDAGTEIGFHRTPFANLSLAGGIDESDFDARVSLDAMRAMSRMTALQFRRAGVDPVILEIALSETIPDCVSSYTLGRGQNVYVTNIEFRSAHKFWIPDRKTINSYRTRALSGWWPSSHAEAAKQLRGSRTKLTKSELAFGAPEDRSITPDIYSPCE